MIKPAMQFSLRSRRAQSMEERIDDSVFGELKNEDDFDKRLYQLQEINNNMNHQITQSSNLSMQSSGKSKQARLQMIETYALLIQEMVHNKELQQFCQSFGFSSKELENFDTVEKREDYVIKQMCQHINTQTQNFITKVELRIHQYRIDEWNELQKMNKQNINIFEWLNVKSKYEHLRKKLQYALIDNITASQKDKKIIQTHSNEISRISRASTSASRRRFSSIQEEITISPKIQLIQEYKGFRGEWNEDLERQFKQKGKSSSILGLYPVIQKAILDNVGQNVLNQQRDRLLTKYTEGGCLTEEEVKFIANTSQLLNSCSDKEFLQRTIQHLDRDIIGQIENNIAECILQTYTNISNDVKAIRQIWLKKINKKLEQKVQDTHFSVLKKMQLSQSQKQLLKVKQKMIVIFKEALNKHSKKMQKELDKDNYIQTQKGINKIILKFKDKVMKKIRRYRSDRNLGIQNQFLNRNLPKPESILFRTKSGIKSTEFVKRMFHPPSKLIIKQKSGQQLGSQTERAIKEESKFKIRPQSTIRQQEYKRFISGGPISDRQYASSILQDTQIENKGLQNPHKWVTSEIEILAINKIKAAIRAFIQKKKYKKMKLLKIEQEENKRSLLSHLTKKSPQRIKQIEMEVITMMKKMKKQQSQSSIYSSKQRLQSDMKLKTRKLFQAAKKKCLNIAIQSGFYYTADDANQQDEYGRTPLSYAAENGDEAICNYLLRLGASVNVQSIDGMTPMHYIFKSNQIGLIIQFLNANGNLNKLNSDGLTPIAFCSQEVMQKLNLQKMISSSIGYKNFDNHRILNQKYQQKQETIEGLEFSGNFSRTQQI